MDEWTGVSELAGVTRRIKGIVMRNRKRGFSAEGIGGILQTRRFDGQGSQR